MTSQNIKFYDLILRTANIINTNDMNYLHRISPEGKFCKRGGGCPELAILQLITSLGYSWHRRCWGIFAISRCERTKVRQPTEQCLILAVIVFRYSNLTHRSLLIKIHQLRSAFPKNPPTAKCEKSTKNPPSAIFPHWWVFGSSTSQLVDFSNQHFAVGGFSLGEVDTT